MQFIEIDEKNIDSITPFLKKYNNGVALLTPLALYMWQDRIKYKYCIFNDVLFLMSENNKKFANSFISPLGENLLDNIDILFDIYKKDSITMQVTESDLIKIEEKFSILSKEYLRDYSEYVYSAQELSNLIGKKFNKKRNLLNQFIKSYKNYSVEEISKDNLTEIKEMAQSLYYDNMQDDERYELNKVEKVLSNYDKFSLFGLILRVDNKIVAFSFGECIGEMFYTHVEKADKEYKGAYQMINKVMADRVKTFAKYINREDDMGDLGLRQSKMTYNPIKLINKYIIKVQKYAGN